MEKQQKQVSNFTIPVYITSKHGKPALELRTLTLDPLAIKIIIERALSKQPITVFPIFSNELKSISSMLDKNILKYDSESNQYEFII